jgi:hypothetical protein
MITPAEGMRIAERALAGRFADAEAGFAAGSIFRGEGTTMSDVDLVVLYRCLPNAWRESFVLDGVPVEAFVHDSETLAWFLSSDQARGRPALLAMIAEGRIFGPNPKKAMDWQRGPPNADRRARAALRGAAEPAQIRHHRQD